MQFHIASDDLAFRTSRGEAASAAPASTRATSPRQRNTWPTSPSEYKAGSHRFDSVPTLVPTPWELERSSQRPRVQRPQVRDHKAFPRRIFEQLPREIYDCVLRQLEATHTVSLGTVDVASRQADLRCLLFVDKRWHHVAREHLYHQIWLPKDEERQPARPLLFSRSRTRLRLLLRTLTDSPGLASLVRHLRVTADLAALLDTVERSAGARRSAYEALTQIISQCPNLETLSGYYPIICDEMGIKLALSLAQCPRLAAHVWNLQAAQLGSARLRQFGAGELISCHQAWSSLETLALCSAADLILGPGVISAIILHLPSLRHLMLSRLSKQDFHNGTLVCLPAVASLRLEHMEGVTDQGVEQLAHSRTVLSLKSLSLIGLELTSLRIVQALLRNMCVLRRFRLVQDTAPEFQPGIESASVMGDFESDTLQYLHWDVLVSGSATTLLANSIASGRFPALRKVKVPCDYDGAIQAICRPLVQQPLNADDVNSLNRSDDGRYERALRLSRIQAQLRVRQSRRQPSFSVIIQDEDDRVQHTHTIGSYLGSVTSRIEYSLGPDIEGSPDALAQFRDVESPRWDCGKENEGRSGNGERLLDLSVLF